MKLRTVKLFDTKSRSSLEWLFEGSIQDAEKDLRYFAQQMEITHWFGIISAMQGHLVIRP